MKKPLFVVAALAASPLLFFSSNLEAQTPAATPPPAAPAAPAANTSQQAAEFYNRGVAALNKNDLKTAAAEFEKAVELAPNDAGAQMFLGYVRLREENYAAALKALEAAQKQTARLDAKLQPILYNNLGIAYANNKRTADAITAYEKALELSTEEYTDARFNLAFALLARKKPNEAIAHLLKLRDRRKDDKVFQSSVYDGLAEAYEAVGNWGQALGAYKEVSILNPNDPTTRFNFALALSKTGRIDDAIKEAREVLKIQAAHAPTLLLLGDLYSRKSNWTQVKNVLSTYVKSDAENFSAWFSLAVAYDYTEEFDRALEAYAEAEKLAPKDPAVKNNIGRIHFKRGEKDPEKYADAITKLKEALALNPSFDDARVNLALVYAAQEEWDEAIGQWKTSLTQIRHAFERRGITAEEKIALKSKSLSVRSALAELYLKSGAYPEAVKEYQTILQETPKNLDAMSNLGLAFYHAKNYEESIKTYREVLRQDPKNAIAHNNLGVALEARGQRAEAIESYQKALQIRPDYPEAKTNIARLTTAT